MVIRRSFRFGLVVGALAGLVLALAKVLGARDDEPAAGSAPGGDGDRTAPAPWPRLEQDPAVPARPDERLVPDPDAPARPAPEAADADPTPALAARPTAATSASAEAPPEADAPAETAPATKAASTKAPATKAAAKKAPAKKAPAKKAATKTAASKKAGPEQSQAWVEPQGEVCPTTHPVKAKLASKIFHVPGGLSYARTRADRCYVDAAAAEADGLRRAKR